MTLYLTNARYIDPVSCSITDTAIKVQPGDGGGITLVDQVPEDAPVFDCASMIVTRSLVIGHHHIYSALARGMPPPSHQPSSFVEILEHIWWRLDKALDPDIIRASAMVSAVEAAKAGTTFIIDHHASPNAARGSLHTIAEALEAVGLNHLLCYELSDRDGPACLKAGFEETDRYLNTHQGLVGLHASFTVGDGLLTDAVALARSHDTGIHVHVAEAESDQQHCLMTHGKRCVQRFADAGALDLPKTILAHCIHLDQTERSTLGSSAAWVSQQTQSNLNNAVGTLDAAGFAHRVMLGTDGMSGDMLAATNTTYLAAQSTDTPSPAEVYQRLRRVHDYLAINKLKGDSDNNLIVLDYSPPTPITSENWPAHLVFGLDRANVHTVIANGRIIVENRRCILVDEDTIYRQAQTQAQRLWERMR